MSVLPSLPAGWTERTLGELSSKTTVGFVGSMSHLFRSTGVPLLRGTNVHPGSLDLREMRFISEATHQLWAKSALFPGDIVMVRVGYPGTAAVVPDDLGPANAASLVITRPKTSVLNPKFAMYVINSPAGIRQLQAQLVGGAQQVFNTTLAAKFLVPVPSREEQDRIVEVLGSTDGLIRRLKQLIEKKRAIKQGLMQELLTGRTRLPGFDGSWRRVAFGDIASPSKDRVDPKNATGRVVELEHLSAGTGVLLGDADLADSVSLKTRFVKGDVLFGKLRAYLRKYWLADRGGFASTEIWALRPRPAFASEQFLRYVVEQDSFIEAASTAYGTHMPRSDWKVVSRYQLSLPPLNEQTAIGSTLRDADTEIAALERRLEATRAVKLGMMQELLTGRTRLVGEGAA